MNKFRLERFAKNRDTTKLIDEDGAMSINGEIVQQNQPILESQINDQGLCHTRNQSGLSMGFWNGAGGYLCNLTYYFTLNYIVVNNIKIICAFAHIPPDDLTTARTRSNYMPYKKIRGATNSTLNKVILMSRPVQQP